MRRLLLILALAALLPDGWPAGEVNAGAQDKQQAVPAQSAATTLPSGYAGAEACATCHQDEVSKFSENPSYPDGVYARRQGCGPAKTAMDRARRISMHASKLPLACSR